MRYSMKCARRVIFVISLTALFFSTIVQAVGADLSPRISVAGEGGVNLAPDMAILELAVVRQEETARAALNASSSAMSAVLAAMKSLGIDERDLQTSGFSIQPIYVYPPAKPGVEREAPRITGYRVRNGLTVRVRDIASVGDVLDKSVTLGVNEGGNIRFTNDDPSSVITSARIDAVQQATAKANTLAEAAGVKIGKVLEISEQSYSPRPQPLGRAQMMMAQSAESVPIAAGENTYKVTVNLIFAIEQ